MALNFKLLVLVIVLCPLTINSFDYFTMVQQWPKGFCYFNVSKCKRVRPDDFTIHGLWPSNFTRSLRNCTSTEYGVIKNLTEWQTRYPAWPDLTRPIPNCRQKFTLQAQSFWQHEWKNHGTCSETMYNQSRYFDIAIQLRGQYKLLNWLVNDGIRQGNNVQISRVNSSILNVTGKVPDLKCDHPDLYLGNPTSKSLPVLQELGIYLDSTSDLKCDHPDLYPGNLISKSLPVLQEIGICLDPNLKVIDCPKKFQRSRTCYVANSKGNIHFP
ncbi:hypothetical protein ACH5RR_001802 [Cinchona calisaya]|uniref:Uncharacterized protein n=1 Tax=Cinchona calisaya TaxID=153742 RepID=A0ABD3B4V3_9GENT